MPLISTASAVATTSGDDTLGTAGVSESFIVDNTTATGADTFTFEGRDSLLTTVKLYDSNNDGIITFGSDKLLDTGAPSGDDQISMVGVAANKGVRYLGEKDGYYVYASAVTKKAGWIEGTVNDDVLHATAGNDVFLFDTALGLNLGTDKIEGFAAGDKIVTTSQIWDHNSDGTINTGDNGLLDLPGAYGGVASDEGGGAGGQVDIGANTHLHFDGTTAGANGTTYYTYSWVAH